jgi:arginase
MRSCLVEPQRGQESRVTVIAVPSHLDEPLPGLDLDVAPAHHLVTIRPGEGETWSRLAAIYDRVAETVAGVEGRPVVVSGDCTTAVGTITGLQRRGLDPGVVWIDAHGDLHPSRPRRLATSGAWHWPWCSATRTDWWS